MESLSTEHPDLQPQEPGWIEKGWLAIRIFENPEKPRQVAASWASEGLNYFEQRGVIDEIGDDLASGDFDATEGDDGQ